MPQPPDIDENLFFREATLNICSSLEIEKALWRTLLYLGRHFAVERLSFHRWDRAERVIETVAYANPQGSVALALRTPVPPRLAQELDRENPGPRVRIIHPSSGEDLAGVIAAGLRWPLRPFLAMQLVLEDQYLGVVALSNREGATFEPRHARLLDLLHDPFAVAMQNMLRYRELMDLKDLLADDYRYLQEEYQRLSGDEIIGADFGLRAVMDLVRRVAPLDSPVLLLGDTGTGKEVIATAIHNLSPRRDGPFIRVNCGAIPETLIDSELFGHEKGAFTGALAQKRGRFERAHRGTILLDEIGELPPGAQVRLLRVLQEREVERVGGSRLIPVDIRVIAATHRDLPAMVQQGAFREDLFFRLSVFPIRIPPLKDRAVDVPALVHHFIRKKTAELGLGRTPDLAPAAIERLLAYPWPGNVRELENTVERALILGQGRPLTFADLIPGYRAESVFASAPVESPLAADLHQPEPDRLDEVEARHIRRVLAFTQGRVEGEKGAARILGLNPGTLRHRMRKLGVPFGRKVKE